MRMVPEVPMEAECINDIGYARAKFVCEQIVERAVQDYPEKLEASYVRLGQIAGTRDTCYWNVHEHLPALFKSSKYVGALPELHGVSVAALMRILSQPANIHVIKDPLLDAR